MSDCRFDVSPVNYPDPDRLSTRRNTQGNNLFVNGYHERYVHPLVNVTGTCDRKEKKNNNISISVDPAQWHIQKFEAP